MHPQTVLTLKAKGTTCIQTPLHFCFFISDFFPLCHLIYIYIFPRLSLLSPTFSASRSFTVHPSFPFGPSLTVSLSFCLYCFVFGAYRSLQCHFTSQSAVWSLIYHSSSSLFDRCFHLTSTMALLNEQGTYMLGELRGLQLNEPMGLSAEWASPPIWTLWPNRRVS